MRRASTYASKGWKQALRDNKHLKEGLNVAQGKLTYAAVGEALGMGYISADEALR